ncbi:MAG: SET domain-containing protein-lysine N-methyltransferase [Verrucomicrobiota bacterium]
MPISTKTPAPSWEVKRSDIHGTGIFARRPIADGERVVEYFGKRILSSQVSRRSDGRVYCIALDEDYVIDGDSSKNPARFANYSCAANCNFEKQDDRLFIIADREIAAGEEITVDYGWGLEGLLKNKCTCGTPSCFGFIVSEPYRPAARRLLNQILRGRSYRRRNPPCGLVRGKKR